MARRLLALLAVSIVGAATLAVAGPASAAPTATIVSVETPQAGHVVVTVESVRPYVGIRLVDAKGILGSDAIRAVDADTYLATVDLTTWGLGAGSKVRVAGCTGNYSSSCTESVEQAFTPVDVAPTITWDEKVRVAADDPYYRISVSDPQGGGSTLRAVFASRGLTVQHAGVTELSYPTVNSVGPIKIFRCRNDLERCVDTGLESPEVEVRTGIPVQAHLSSYGTVGPRPDHPVMMSVYAAPGDYLLDSWVEGAAGLGESDVPVTIEGTAANPDRGMISVGVDLAGAPEGKKRIRIRLKRDYPGFGTVSGTAPWDIFDTIEVDLTAPLVKLTVGSTFLNPYPDGYRDFVEFTLVTDGLVTLDVLGPSGAVVRTFSHPGYIDTYWDGRDSQGRIVPAGTYTLRATGDDGLGNTTVVSRTVAVSSQRLVTKTFRRKVSAAGSLVHKYAGGCSKIAKPAARGWTGSLGLYSNTKCKKGWAKSVVETIHEMRVPTGVYRYQTLQVTTYGGAAKSARGSYLFLDQWRAKAEKWGDDDKRLGYALGKHVGPTRQAAPFITEDGWTAWSVWTGDGARYDVRDFTVELTYQVLV